MSKILKSQMCIRNVSSSSDHIKEPSLQLSYFWVENANMHDKPTEFNIFLAEIYIFNETTSEFSQKLLENIWTKQAAGNR